MSYFLETAVPFPWFIADIIVLILSLVVLVFIMNRSKRPSIVLLEAFAIVFLYGTIFENFAVVQDWYVFGRSYMMVGDVTLAIPLIEMDVILLGLWLLDQMEIKEWCKPFIVGLFGMLLDFALDSVAMQQVYVAAGKTTGRWTWLIAPSDAQMYQVPVYNYSGWMLIMGLGSAFLLLGRWWYKKSGYKPAVGYSYPFITILGALITLALPTSKFLLWAWPFTDKGSNSEWVMLIIWLVVPVVLLAVFWRGKMKEPVLFKDGFPVYVFPAVLYLVSLIFVLVEGYWDILWLVLVVAFLNMALLGFIYFKSYKLKLSREAA